MSIKDKRGSVTLLKYDALNRLTEKRMPISADGSGSTVWSIERYLYNSAGNLVKKTLTGTKDKLDTRETTYTYYLNNQLKTVSDSSGPKRQTTMIKREPG